MTGEEFIFLNRHALQGSETKPAQPAADKDKKYVYGIGGIARLFGCSIPTANRIKKSGRIDRAITQIVNPEKPDVPLNKNDAFQKVQKRRVQEKR